MELAWGHHLLGRGCTFPQELRQKTPATLEKVHLDGVLLARRKRNRPNVLSSSVKSPVVDQLLAVDKQLHAVIAFGVEGVSLAVLRLHFACPPDGEIHIADGGIG